MLQGVLSHWLSAYVLEKALKLEWVCRFGGTQPLARGSLGCNNGRMIAVGRAEERESLAAPGACAGTAAVRYDVAAEAIAWANLLGNDVENVTFTGRQL